VAHLFCRRRYRQYHKELKIFIHKKIHEQDFTDRLPEKNLKMLGRVHDLEPIYTQVNHDYFDSKFDLRITWYGRTPHAGARSPKSITFGLYEPLLNLVKIHRRLDRVVVPEYFVAFVVYHEMLHHLIPPQIDKKGRICFHSAAFREEEKKFIHYEQAKQWEQKYGRS
jgi:hypothetical protein